MKKVRRMALALAVPAVAVGAIAFTAHSALSAPGAEPAVALTEQQNQQKPVNPPQSIYTNFSKFTNFTYKTPKSPASSATKTATKTPTKTATKTPTPTKTTPSKSPTSGSPSGSATGGPGGSGAPGGGAGGGAAANNCAGKKAQAPLTVKVTSLGGHDALADADGCALYVFNQDNATTSACDTTCESTWPPAPGPGTAGDGVEQQNLGTFARTSGFTQVTYFTKQLYYYSGDKSPGETNGQNVDQSWFLVDPAGNPITQ